MYLNVAPLVYNVVNLGFNKNRFHKTSSTESIAEANKMLNMIGSTTCLIYKDIKN